jgi:hypothetical protein
LIAVNIERIIVSSAIFFAGFLEEGQPTFC